jgi:putative sugar O-methyltransferase
MNLFILKDYIRALVKHDTLPFDRDLFSKFMDAAVKASEYWTQYVPRITREINNHQLKRFGKNYELTRGFGDAMAYPRHRIKNALKTRTQKILRFPFFYIPAETLLTDFRQSLSRRRTFKENANHFDDQGFISYLVEEIAPVTRRLGVNRYFLVKGKDIPWGYMQTFVYFQLIKAIIQKHEEKKSLADLFDGNVMDIGGGYGPFLDSIGIFKQYNDVGNHSVNFLLDQFPVTFIANQYLKYRHRDQLRAPVISKYNNDLGKRNDNAKSTQSFQVIQNNMTDHLSGLNIKLFFNSNSFQEMDSAQITAFTDMVQKNKAAGAKLASFIYSNQRNAPDETVLNILNSKFTLIGSQSFWGRGFVTGTMYLFDV